MGTSFVFVLATILISIVATEPLLRDVVKLPSLFHFSNKQSQGLGGQLNNKDNNPTWWNQFPNTPQWPAYPGNPNWPPKPPIYPQPGYPNTGYYPPCYSPQCPEYPTYPMYPTCPPYGLNGKKDAQSRSPTHEQEVELHGRYFKLNDDGSKEYKLILSNGLIIYQKILNGDNNDKNLKLLEGYYADQMEDGSYVTTYFKADENGYSASLEKSPSPPSYPDITEMTYLPLPAANNK